MGYPDQDYEELVDLLKEAMQWHSDPENYDYQGCDNEPCDWCERAKRLIEE